MGSGTAMSGILGMLCLVTGLVMYRYFDLDVHDCVLATRFNMLVI